MRGGCSGGDEDATADGGKASVEVLGCAVDGEPADAWAARLARAARRFCSSRVCCVGGVGVGGGAIESDMGAGCEARGGDVDG